MLHVVFYRTIISGCKNVTWLERLSGARMNGWHHHMAMVFMAALFMLKERIENRKDVTLLSCQDIVELLNIYLPRGDLSEEEIFRQMEKRHKKRQKSIESEYKKQRELSILT